MLDVWLQRRLTKAVSASLRAAAAAEARSQLSELERLVNQALGALRELEELAGWESGRLGQHLGFILYWHRKGRPEPADGDIGDIRERDVDELLAAVERRSQPSGDRGLRADHLSVTPLSVSIALTRRLALLVSS